MKPGTNSISCAKSAATVSKTTSIAVVEPDASICERTQSCRLACLTPLPCLRVWFVRDLCKLCTRATLASVGVIFSKLKLNSTRLNAQWKKKNNIKRKTKIPVSPKAALDKCHISPLKTTCLLGIFVKVTGAQAERLVVGLGCMWESFQNSAHLRSAPRACSGVAPFFLSAIGNIYRIYFQ